MKSQPAITKDGQTVDVSINFKKRPPRGLGRMYSPDPRDRKFPMRAIVGTPTEYPSKRWHLGTHEIWRDQGPTPTCVGHGIVHLLSTTGVVRHLDQQAPFEAYKWAQQNDEWPGEDYDGTSVRAGIEWARKAIGAVASYHWAQTMDDVLARLTLPAAQGGGPVIVGTDFYSGMSNDRGDARWRVDGEYWGGHCWLLIGYERARKTTAAPTTRGDAITGNSHAGNHVGRISIEELDYLLFQTNGEAAACVEQKAA